MLNLKKILPTLKRLLSYKGNSLYKKPLIFAIGKLWIAAISEASGPFLISYFIDEMVAKCYLPIGLVIELIAVYISLQFIAAKLHYAQSLIFNQAATSIVQQMRIDIMDTILRQPLSNLNIWPIGQIISRITNDTEVIRDFYVTIIGTFLRSIILIAVVLIAMFSLNWRMALLTTTLFPAVLIIMIIYQKYSTPIVRRMRDCLANINSKFNEVINGMIVIQQFRQQERFGEQIEQASWSHYMMRMQTLRLDSFLLRPLLSLFSMLVLCGLLILFDYISDESIEVGVFYAFISYLSRLNEPLIELITQQSILQQAMVAGERIFELIDMPHQTYGSDNRLLQNGKISFKNVSFSYKKNHITLKDINLNVSSGSLLALVGHSGSGKSTFANLLMRYYSPSCGNIYVDDRPLTSLSHNTLRKGIAIVQQDPVILADTLYANIALGRPYTHEQVWEVLKIVQLSDFAYSLKKGINTCFSEQGNNLSVGQKQLLAIARVLIEVPKILILDEVTANIDSGTEKVIQSILANIRKKTTLVVITHRFSTILDADIILVFYRGQIVERGNHNKLLRNRGYYWKMYQLQSVNKKVSRDIF